MSTPSTMILRSLRLIGERIIGDTLSTAEQTAYLADLNAMMESWSLEGLMVPHLLQESLALTADTATYTIGPGGAFNAARPTKIVDPCFIRDSDNNDTPVEIIGAIAYGSIVGKSVDSSYPTYLFYDSSNTNGMGTIKLYPPPSAGLTLYINSWKQLTQFASITETVALPPGYRRAIEFNFAIEVAGGFINVSPEVAAVAKSSKAAIKSLNTPAGILSIDPMLSGRGTFGQNIFTGG